jgi:Arc/MetJ-type ribon-helix-helix transcriptional regulator
MTIQLPEDLARYVQNEVLSGHFASEQDAITEAVRLLRQRKQETAVQEVKPVTEDELVRQLVESGFLASTPPRPSPTVSRREFQPITIQGEPLSETVIRERR